MSGTESEICKFAIRSRYTRNQGKPCWSKIKNGPKFRFLAPKWRQNHYWRKWRQKCIFAQFHDFSRKSLEFKSKLAPFNWRHFTFHLFFLKNMEFQLSLEKKIISISFLDNFLTKNKIAHGLLIFSWKSPIFENITKSQFFFAISSASYSTLKYHLKSL